MIHFRRTVLFALLALRMIAVLAACGSSDDEQATSEMESEAQVVTDAPVTVSNEQLVR